MENIIKYYERALTGKEMSENEFNKILPRKLKELAKKYDITFNSGEVVPQDMDMCKRLFNAGVELLQEVGVYCIDTERIISIKEEEIGDALKNAPSSYVSGTGAEASECYSRGISDSRRPKVIGGANGSPLSEENYLAILLSCAKEPVDGLHTGSLQSLYGQTVKAKSPIEVLACKQEVVWAREAIKKAGKPGMGILGVMSGVTSEAQNAGDFERGLRPSDMHLVVSLNELKVDFDFFKKVIHNQYQGNIIDACIGGPIFGGYCGGPEGTAITGVAEVIQGYVMCNPNTFSMYPSSMFTSTSTDRVSIWVGCAVPMAIKSSGFDLVLAMYVGGNAGPCTEMLCDEVTAQSVAQTVSGVSALYGAVGSRMVKTDYVTGMESRILYETSKAATGLTLSEANTIVKELIGRYEDSVKIRDIPEGKSFTECYNIKELTPNAEYVELWEKRKEKLKDRVKF